MGWLEGILSFLKQGPKGGKLDMNGLFLQALNSGIIDDRAAIREINALIKWQMARKRWHQDKTRQKMAAEGTGEDVSVMPGLANTFRSSDFGLDEVSIPYYISNPFLRPTKFCVLLTNMYYPPFRMTLQI